MAKDVKNEAPKRIYTTEIINRLLEDAARGLEIDTAPFFMGDLELRAPNIVFQYTDWELEEFKRCMEDPIYFVANYCKFQNDKGRTTVKLRDFQEDILHLYCDQHYDEELDEFIPDNRNIITMASRQTGKCHIPTTKVITKNGEIEIGKLYKEKETILSKIKSFLYKLYNYKIYFYIKCLIGFIIQLIEKYELRNYELDENDISKKIINSQKLENIKVLSDTGYYSAVEIHKTQPYRVYRLELSNGYFIECADKHILFDDNLNEIFAKDLNIGDKILTDQGSVDIIKIIKMPYKLCMYDLTIDSNDHRYYTNNILSHNTTTTAGFMAWYLCFHYDRNIMALANKQTTATEIVDKVIQIFRGLPFWLKPGAINFAKLGITLDNGCRLLSSATTASTSIGFTIHILYIDEFSHIPANIIEPFWRSVYPTMSSSRLSQCIITSTPNGQNMFYDIYSKSSMGTSENSFKGMRIDYWQVPGHDDAWADQMRKDFGPELFAQEFELQFTVNSKMLLKGSDLQFMDRIKINYGHRTLFNHPLLKTHKLRWHPNFDPYNINPNDKFLMCVDIAEGKEYDDDVKEKQKEGPDYNVINIFKIIPNSLSNIKSKNRFKKVENKDCYKCVQIGVFEDNEGDEEHCANMTSAILYNIFEANMHDNVRIMVEMNFQGKNYVTQLKKEANYSDDIIIKTYHSEPVPGEKRKKKPGFKTTSTKEYFCKKGAKMIGDKRIIITDPRSIKQLASFGKVKNKLQGIAMHDDISVTVLNNLPRVFEEDSFIGWAEDLIENNPDKSYKYNLNQIIQKWELDNPEMSDTYFDAIINNDKIESINNLNIRPIQMSYSQLMNHH